MRKAFLPLVVIAAIQGGLAAALSTPARALAGYEPGTIVVKTSERRLYYVLENGQTAAYPVAVGKPGKTWTGVATSKENSSTGMVAACGNPADKPNMPDVIPGGTPKFRWAPRP